MSDEEYAGIGGGAHGLGICPPIHPAADAKANSIENIGSPKNAAMRRRTAVSAPRIHHQKLNREFYSKGI